MHDHLDLVAGCSDQRNGETAVKVLRLNLIDLSERERGREMDILYMHPRSASIRCTCLHDAIEGLQLAAYIRRPAAAYAIDEDAPLVEPIRDGEAIVIVDSILVQCDMEDALLLLLLLLRLRLILIAAARLGVGRWTARTSLHLGIDGLRRSRQAAAGAAVDVVAAQDLEVHDIAQMMQQAGGMRQRHALHRVLVDGQQLVAHVDLSVLERNAA